MSLCVAVQFKGACSFVRSARKWFGRVVSSRHRQSSSSINADRARPSPKPSKHHSKGRLTSPRDGGSNEAPDLGRPRNGGDDGASALKSDVSDLSSSRRSRYVAEERGETYRSSSQLGQHLFGKLGDAPHRSGWWVVGRRGEG